MPSIRCRPVRPRRVGVSLPQSPHLMTQSTQAHQALKQRHARKYRIERTNHRSRRDAESDREQNASAWPAVSIPN